MQTSQLPFPHEQATIKAFVIRARQERCLYLLGDPKRRRKFLAELGHFRWLDRKYVTVAPWNPDPNLSLWERHLDGINKIHKLLQSKGAGNTCWAISQNGEIDARELQLDEALENAIDSDSGTILSCIPGRLAYFKDEEESLLLSR